MNTLTLYFIPSPRPLDWCSPSKLARSIVKNQIIRKHRFMGHVNARLRYREYDILTGMCAEDVDISRRLLLVDKVGLGIMYHSYAGHLETKTELEKEFEIYYKRGNSRMNYIEFAISDETADLILKYLKIYKDENLEKNYGLVHSPLHGEGAGCSAFGASFLILTGLLTGEMRNSWSQTRLVPKSLAGAPLTDNKVSFLKLLLGNKSWAKEDEEHHKLFFWDPDLMWSWVESKINSNQTKYQITQKRNVTGLFIDKSQETLNLRSDLLDKIKSNDPDLTKPTNIDLYDMIFK